MKLLEDKTKRFMIVLLLSVISGTVDTLPYVNIKTKEGAVNTNESNITCMTEYSCLNCTTVRLCTHRWNGSLVKLLDFKCGVDAPYCDFNTGTCRESLLNDSCAPEDSSFFCPSDGYFPHPTDCRKYYSCIRGTAHLLHCVGSSHYSSKSENCQNSYECYITSCSGKSGKKVAYGGNRSFYVYCFEGAVLRFDKCPGKFQLDENLQICVPTCTEEGQQGDPYDCTKYYRCSFDESMILELSHHQCPQGTWYDSLNFHCTPIGRAKCDTRNNFFK